MDLFANVARKYDIKLHDSENGRKFLDVIGKSLGRNNTPIMLHGFRTESMFCHVVESLGKCRVIKKEDAGEVIMHTDSAKVPDYRIVTHNDQQLLVEVKELPQSRSVAYLQNEERLRGWLNGVRQRGRG